MENKQLIRVDPRSSVAQNRLSGFFSILLEVKAQRKLQVSCQARLAGHFPERGRSRIERRHSAPVGMVRKIESLRAEFESGPLVDGELLIQAGIPVLETRLVDFVANARLQVEGARGRR